MKDFKGVVDSGVREKFKTGSRRDTRKGKGRFDLLPPYAIFRLARHYENGAVKYGPNNWRKGQPISRYLDSCFRHLVKVVAGADDEDHEAAVVWNMMSIIETRKMIAEGILPKELDDMGDYYKYTPKEWCNDSSKKAKCHPDRDLYTKGMCRSCYEEHLIEIGAKSDKIKSERGRK